MDALRSRATVTTASQPAPCGPQDTSLQIVFGTATNSEEQVDKWVAVDQTEKLIYVLTKLLIIPS